MAQISQHNKHTAECQELILHGQTGFNINIIILYCHKDKLYAMISVQIMTTER
jgi:hypothetical protein